MKTKYGLRDLQGEFPNDDAVLEFVFDTLHSRKCSCGGTYHKIEGRRQYQCSKCRFQIAPTSGTIFHKSDTPLTLWFHALWVFSNAKSGISAKEMERQLAVTYKTAWRMLNLIRKALKQGSDKLKGDVELDSAYFGGKRYAGKNNENLSHAVRSKSVVLAAVERGGHLRAKVVPDNKAQTQWGFIRNNIEPTGTRLMTDKTKALDGVAYGFDRHAVDHHKKEFARGDIHVNHVETFWAHAKRSIRGTHKVISKKHLQAYLDGFVFHYNNRHSDKARFALLLGTVLHGVKA